MPLSGDQARVYDLVVRRFLATLLPPAVIESQRADLASATSRSRRAAVASPRPGFLSAWQPYTSEREKPLPTLTEGDVRHGHRGAQRRQGDATAEPLRPGSADREDGRARSRDQGDAGRHHPAPLRPQLRARQPGRADRARHRASSAPSTPPCATRRSTSRQAGDDRRARARDGRDRRQRHAARQGRQREPGDARAGVTRRSRGTSSRSARRSRARRATTSRWASARVCGGELRMLRGKTGKRFVACAGKPEDEPKVPEGAPEGTRPRRGCGQTFPLPQRGAIMPLGTTCKECGWPEIKVLSSSGRGRPWQLCLDPDCPTKEKYKKRKPRDASAAGPRLLHRLRRHRSLRQVHAGRGAARHPDRTRSAGRPCRACREARCASPAARPPARRCATLLLHRDHASTRGPKRFSTPPPGRSSSPTSSDRLSTPAGW